MSVHVERWRFTVEEYHRMAEVGLLGEDDRVELIDGELIRMNPIGPMHLGHVNRLVRLFNRLPEHRSLISPQNPLRLGDVAEPQPDLVLLRPRADDYGRAVPAAADALLVVEVADASLAYDREVKGPLYATAGIADYWIVDLDAGQLLVFRDPSPEGYRSVTVVTRDGSVTPLAFPELTLAVSDVLI